MTGTGNDKEIKNADGCLLDDSCLDPTARNVPRAACSLRKSQVLATKSPYKSATLLTACYHKGALHLRPWRIIYIAED